MPSRQFELDPPVGCIADDAPNHLHRAELEAATADLRGCGEIELQHDKTILVIVGQRMPERPGLGATILQGIADVGVNVEMVSYGLDSINFTMLIDDADIGRAVQALHTILFEGC